MEPSPSHLTGLLETGGKPKISATGASACSFMSTSLHGAGFCNARGTLVQRGWHLYTISLRLVNWLHALSFFEEQMRDDRSYRQQFIGSLYGQAQILAGDLETDVRGNHLLENLCALLTAGSAFEGKEPQTWVQKAWKILEQELEEQILADGGHFERCPGYHVRVLKILLEMSVWLAR